MTCERRVPARHLHLWEARHLRTKLAATVPANPRKAWTPRYRLLKARGRPKSLRDPYWFRCIGLFGAHAQKFPTVEHFWLFAAALTGRLDPSGGVTNDTPAFRAIVSILTTVVVTSRLADQAPVQGSSTWRNAHARSCNTGRAEPLWRHPLLGFRRLAVTP